MQLNRFTDFFRLCLVFVYIYIYLSFSLLFIRKIKKNISDWRLLYLLRKRATLWDYTFTPVSAYFATAHDMRGCKRDRKKTSLTQLTSCWANNEPRHYQARVCAQTKRTTADDAGNKTTKTSARVEISLHFRRLPHMYIYVESKTKNECILYFVTGVRPLNHGLSRILLRRLKREMRIHRCSRCHRISFNDCYKFLCWWFLFFSISNSCSLTWASRWFFLPNVSEQKDTHYGKLGPKIGNDRVNVSRKNTEIKDSR